MVEPRAQGGDEFGGGGRVVEAATPVGQFGDGEIGSVVAQEADELLGGTVEGGAGDEGDDGLPVHCVAGGEATGVVDLVLPGEGDAFAPDFERGGTVQLLDDALPLLVSGALGAFLHGGGDSAEDDIVQFTVGEVIDLGAVAGDEVADGVGDGEGVEDDAIDGLGVLEGDLEGDEAAAAVAPDDGGRGVDVGTDGSDVLREGAVIVGAVLVGAAAATHLRERDEAQLRELTDGGEGAFGGL